MTDNGLQKKVKYEVARDFRTLVAKLEADLKNIADGEIVFAGTEENPILTNHKQLPIEKDVVALTYEEYEEYIKNK